MTKFDSKKNNTSPKKATVLIIDDQSTRTLQISHTTIRVIKPALLTLGLSTVLLGSASLYLGAQYWQSKNQAEELSQQVVDLENATSAEVTAKLKQLGKSEKVIANIKQYLQNRGVSVRTQTADSADKKTIQLGKNDAAGGPLGVDLDNPLPEVGQLTSETEQLIQHLRKVPIGVPHNGSLSSRFGFRANPFTGRGGEMHSGLDFRGDVGNLVQATADGVVIVAEHQGGYGNVVKIQHGFGYQTIYAHLNKISVKDGQKITAGDVIGQLGNTGRSTGPHLHYEVRRSGAALDPESFLSLNSKL
ncbi:M23 family metallopeptidase [Stenoxybacter acetivorans]|uniref:M23 family metallopeptidase n=1 Tax=Stenoxybacter acetivorans TaxID=422441 RepID=UPI00068D257B|nr:M23 family metallopeptidase [Stenoxybacter acetivorans]